MKMIERYIYAVVRRLPEKSRADVEKELRANIGDMLPEAHTESDVEKVLMELGSPDALAGEYRDAKHYLISPRLFSSYLFVLKLVMVITVCVASIAAFVGIIADSGISGLPETIGLVITNILASAFEAAVQSFAWVTLVFAIVEQTGVADSSLPFSSKNWKPSELPDIPANKQHINISDPVASIVAGIIFPLLLIKYHEYIGVYFSTGGGVQISPLFTPEIFKNYIPFIVVLVGISIAVSVLKLVYQRWNTPVAAANAVYNIAGIVFYCFFMLDGRIFNAEFKTSLAQVLDISAQRFSEGFQWGVWALLALILIGHVTDTVTGFIRAKRR